MLTGALFALAVQGCVYYYPVRDAGGTVYYTEKPYRAESADFANAAYYPWWSLDYYYLGKHNYRPAYFSPVSDWHFSLGLSYAYSPFYPWYGPHRYPYYFGFGYSPWYYWPHYTFGFNYWYDPYWYHCYYKHPHHRHRHGDDYAHRGGPYSGGDFGMDRRDGVNRYAPPRDDRSGAATSRFVSVAPASGSRDRGMEVRSRADRKIRESHIGPSPVTGPSSVVRVTTPGVSVAPAGPVASPGAMASPPAMVRQVPAPQSRSYAAPARTSPAYAAPPRTAAIRPSPANSGPSRSAAPVYSTPSQSGFRGSDGGPSPDSRGDSGHRRR